MSADKPLVMISAGGTGGHLFPAEALAGILRARGCRIMLVTDNRIGPLAETFPADEVVAIPAATPSGRSAVAGLKALVTLARGFLQARRLVARARPAVVVGFGGYPTVPPLLAGSLAGCKTVLHEQNGVIGRANRFLAGRVTHLASSVPELRGVPEAAKAKIVMTGNPVRPNVLDAAQIPYPAATDDAPLNLLAFGGSQGARVISDVVPQAIGLLAPELRARIRITQQARPEDLERVRAAYAAIGVAGEVEPFFRDLPGRIASAHLVISRSGASTVSELAVIGRPAILVPLPGALDQDQAANAALLADIGAALMLPQTEFTPERLAQELATRLCDPDGLTKAAQAAKSAGVPDAAERLADLVMRLAGAQG
ncbi:MAG: undecaprenyldiphospho-muramoylpentapeptide beta-N-acetylglucosaminyltransferase [Salinarimonas sp.]|nr:undecaprenyldiphospho-muramoylpentapeptide beta-N-acetylglucosaminyltransferase [Salinarimonas sp.]